MESENKLNESKSPNNEDVIDLISSKIKDILIENEPQNVNELKQIMSQNDKNGNNFAQYFIYIDNPDMIHAIFQKFKEVFNEEQFREILKSKDQLGRNLLQIAVCWQKDIKIFKILWTAFRDYSKSNDEFLNILKEVDSTKNNIFHIASGFSTSEVFEYMINELAKVASIQKIRELLSTFGSTNQNLFQTANHTNKSISFHASLWTIMH